MTTEQADTMILLLEGLTQLLQWSLQAQQVVIPLLGFIAFITGAMFAYQFFKG